MKCTVAGAVGYCCVKNQIIKFLSNLLFGWSCEKKLKNKKCAEILQKCLLEMLRCISSKYFQIYFTHGSQHKSRIYQSNDTVLSALQKLNNSKPLPTSTNASRSVFMAKKRTRLSHSHDKNIGCAIHGKMCKHLSFAM